MAAALAFLLGYAVNQASTCAVTAAKLLLHDGQTGLTFGFGLAVGIAGTLTMPLAWLLDSAAHLAPWLGISAGLLIGAVLLGLGAVINDACLFGTLNRIGNGELRFALLPAGLGLGFMLAALVPELSASAAMPNPLAQPSLVGAAALLGFVLLAAAAWRVLARQGQARFHPAAWPLRYAMALFGLAGALLYAFVPGWTYADAVRRAVSSAPQMMASAAAALCAAATVSGTVVSGLRSNRFKPQRPTLTGAVRSLLGGIVMAVGATLIPGGNDSLLFAALPALSPGGVTAYAVMTGTVLALVASLRRFRQAP